MRDLRDAVGRERFDTYVTRGKNMTYDQLIAWLSETIDALANVRASAP